MGVWEKMADDNDRGEGDSRKTMSIEKQSLGVWNTLKNTDVIYERPRDELKICKKDIIPNKLE